MELALFQDRLRLSPRNTLVNSDLGLCLPPDSMTERAKSSYPAFVHWQRQPQCPASAPRVETLLGVSSSPISDTNLWPGDILFTILSGSNSIPSATGSGLYPTSRADAVTHSKRVEPGAWRQRTASRTSQLFGWIAWRAGGGYVDNVFVILPCFRGRNMLCTYY